MPGLLALGLAAFETGCSSMLYYPSYSEIIPPVRVGVSPEDVTFRTEDGLNLHGWYLKARGRAHPRALIVFFHGNAENMTSHYVALSWILDHGYDYFIFDYRGYGISQGKPSPHGTILDGMAAMRWAKQRAKGIPLVVFGQSLGGAVALRTVAELRNEISPKLVVVDSTFASYEAAGRRVLSRFWLTWPFQWLADLFLSDRWAPEGHIREISPIPLVVMHGDKDRVIDIQLGQKVFELAGEPKEFWRVPGARHTEALWMKGGEIRKRLLRKLDEVLGERMTAKR